MNTVINLNSLTTVSFWTAERPSFLFFKEEMSPRLYSSANDATSNITFTSQPKVVSTHSVE